MKPKHTRKPSITLVGLPFELAKSLQPVKICLDMLTGATNGSPELKGLKQTATDKEIISKLNEIIRRLNASGGDHV